MNSPDINSIYIVAGIIVSIGTIITSVAMFIRWLVKHYLAELKPNSGSSLRDQINRLEARQDKSDTLRKETYSKVEKLELKIDDLYDKFIHYLSNK